MTNKSLYIIWAVLFAICAALGFLVEPEGLDKGICVVMSLLFFLPPGAIVYLSWKKKDWEPVRLVRNLALGSLALTLAALVANFLTLGAPVLVGDVLYALLVILSTPMVCSQIWVISLVLWAALMWTCISVLSKKE